MLKMLKTLDAHLIYEFGDSDKFYKYSTVGNLETDILGGTSLERNVAKMLTKLEIRGYNYDDLQKIRTFGRRNPTVAERQLLSKNQQLRQKLAEMEKKMAESVGKK